MYGHCRTNKIASYDVISHMIMQHNDPWKIQKLAIDETLEIHITNHRLMIYSSRNYMIRGSLDIIDRMKDTYFTSLLLQIHSIRKHPF